MDQIENAVEYATSDQTPYTSAQVIAIAYQLVFQTVLFLGKELKLVFNISFPKIMGLPE